MQVEPIVLAYNTAYLVEDQGWRILIDAGPDYEGAWDTLQEALKGRTPQLVIATHGHVDHAGLAARWQRAGVPVAIGADDRPLVHAPQLASDEQLGWFVSYAESAGTPASVMDDVIHALRERQYWARRLVGEGYPPAGRGSRWPTGLHFEPFEPDLLIDRDGPIPGTGLEVRLCPGHTPGNLVIFEPGSRTLFPGDQLLPDLTPTPGIQFTADGRRFPSLPAFVTSLHRVRELGAAQCYPGHGAPFSDVNGLIDANLAQIEQRTARIREAVAAEPNIPAYALAERIYPRALRRRFWQIIATVQGHLDLLD
jgi:glyoxylase-like metal-dependent hydrolase (beta-lactamase superfamily II)